MTPLAGSFHSTRSGRFAAFGVPSATITTPACCEYQNSEMSKSWFDVSAPEGCVADPAPGTGEKTARFQKHRKSVSNSGNRQSPGSGGTRLRKSVGDSICEPRGSRGSSHRMPEQRDFRFGLSGQGKSGFQFVSPCRWRRERTCNPTFSFSRRISPRFDQVCRHITPGPCSAPGSFEPCPCLAEYRNDRILKPACKVSKQAQLKSSG